MVTPALGRIALVSFIALVLLAARPGRARACDFKPYPDTFVTSGSPSDGAPVPSAPTLAKVEITRSKHAPPGMGDCAEVGSVTLSFTLDGAAWPANLGIRLRFDGGTLPGFMTLPDAPLRVTDGALWFGGGDDPAIPYAVILQATAVDANGNESSPTRVQIVSAGRSEGGCAFPHPGEDALAIPISLLGLFLIRRARARKCSTN